MEEIQPTNQDLRLQGLLSSVLRAQATCDRPLLTAHDPAYVFALSVES